jgi:hypothetical protein
MLIAAIRTGHALAGKAVTYNEEDGRFWLTGSGEIPATRLLEYDERRELDWADDVTREWALEMASILARKQAAEERQQAAAAAAAAAEAARLEALAPPSVVYPPPETTPPRPDGIPALAPKFELSPEARDRRPRWVVWAEASPLSETDPGADVAATRAARGDTAGPTPQSTAGPAQLPGRGPDRPASTVPSGRPAASGPSPGAPASAPGAPASSGLDRTAGGAAPRPTSRRERRSVQRERARRGERAGAGLRIAIYFVVAAVAAAVVYLIQRGGF